MRYILAALATASVLPLAAAEMAAYDSNGRVIALLSPAGDVPVTSNLVAVLPTGKRIPLLREARRTPGELAWTASIQLPDGGRGKAEYKAVEDATCIKYSISITAGTRLDLKSLDFVLDFPRKEFLGGTVNRTIPLTAVRGINPLRLSGEMSALALENAGQKIDVRFDAPRETTLVDRWDNFARTFQTRTTIKAGAWEPNTTAKLEATITFQNTMPANPVAISIDTSKPKHKFDGFGGNYCWNNQSPISKYTLDNLKIAWARSEMKVQQWDRQRDNPGPELKADFETMRRFQQMGVPFVISIWWLPERFYTDAFEKPRMAHFRLIDPLKWDELLELLGSYLLYAKKEYGVEPDLFSFNEANIGIYVGQTPEAHTYALKRIGAYFEKIGLKTKMLLGDATGPRDTHRFVLDAATDAEALRYVGAIGFHSWGGGTPEQYTAWGDAAEWLGLPLLVTELGVDAAAYNNRTWDMYQYGLREAQMIQELLIYARPQGTQYWQFTNDYALARVKDDKVEPLNRFWLMKHFTDLTPQKSEALAATSDQKNVLVTVFRKGTNQTVHILNLGGARSAAISGLSGGTFAVKQSTETAQYQDRTNITASDSKAVIELPERSLTTLISR